VTGAPDLRHQRGRRRSLRSRLRHPAAGGVGLTLLTAVMLGHMAYALPAKGLTGRFPALVTALWQQRVLDVWIQMVLIFAGVLGILGLLAEGKLSRMRDHGHAGNGHKTVKISPPTACDLVGSGSRNPEEFFEREGASMTPLQIGLLGVLGLLGVGCYGLLITRNLIKVVIILRSSSRARFSRWYSQGGRRPGRPGPEPGGHRDRRRHHGGGGGAGPGVQVRRRCGSIDVSAISTLRG